MSIVQLFSTVDNTTTIITDVTEENALRRSNGVFDRKEEITSYRVSINISLYKNGFISLTEVSMSIDEAKEKLAVRVFDLDKIMNTFDYVVLAREQEIQQKIQEEINAQKRLEKSRALAPWINISKKKTISWIKCVPRGTQIVIFSPHTYDDYPIIPKKFLQSNLFGIDCEFDAKSLNRNLALIQIYTKYVCVLIQLVKPDGTNIQVPPQIIDLFQNPDKRFAFFSMHNDIEGIRSLGLDVVNKIDIVDIIKQNGDRIEGVSLVRLYNHFRKRNYKKMFFGKSKWTEKLTREQILYSIADAYATYYCYKKLLPTSKTTNDT